MIDYNDGNWHGWNGGECPVHPESVVWVIPCKGAKDYTPEITARNASWSGNGHIAAFRVVKPYQEPREFYVREITCFDLDGNVTGKVYQQCSSKENPAFLVREVIE